MIELRNVRYKYPGTGNSWALNGLDLEVREGELILVAGASGSGKSTLAYILSGIIPHFLGGELQGQVIVARKDVSTCKPGELLPHVGLVLQNADAQLFNPTVEQELAFGLESLGIPEEEICSILRQTATRFGLEHLLSKSPSQLSGGEKRLVGVASLACMPSPVLILDEPLAHLDEEGSARVRGLLEQLRAEGRTILIVEHRVQSLLEVVDRCVILEGGRICFQGQPAEAREELCLRGLIPVYPPRAPRHLSDRPVLLEVRNLFSTVGGKEVLRGVSFQVHEGQVVAIVGPNGAGKTTLVRHLNGLARPKRGQVLLGGEPLGHKDPSDLASQVGLVFQNPNDQFFCTSVKEEILAGPVARKSCSPPKLEQLSRTLNLSHLSDRSPYRLSEGEKRRVAMASVLAMAPKLLVLDEPTAGQDGRARMELARIIGHLSEAGCTVVVVTHDRAFAMAVADRCILIEKEGRVVSELAPKERTKRWVAGCAT